MDAPLSGILVMASLQIFAFRDSNLMESVFHAFLYFWTVLRRLSSYFFSGWFGPFSTSSHNLCGIADLLVFSIVCNCRLGRMSGFSGVCFLWSIYISWNIRNRSNEEKNMDVAIDLV